MAAPLYPAPPSAATPTDEAPPSGPNPTAPPPFEPPEYPTKDATAPHAMPTPVDEPFRGPPVVGVPLGVPPATALPPPAFAQPSPPYGHPAPAYPTHAGPFVGAPPPPPPPPPPPYKKKGPTKPGDVAKISGAALVGTVVAGPIGTVIGGGIAYAHVQKKRKRRAQTERLQSRVNELETQLTGTRPAGY